MEKGAEGSHRERVQMGASDRVRAILHLKHCPEMQLGAQGANRARVGLGHLYVFILGGGEELNRDHHFLDPNARQSRPGMAGEPGS